MTRGAENEHEKAATRRKKQMGKAYEKYAGKFTPKPKIFSNCLHAFFTGGLICVLAFMAQNKLSSAGLSESDAGAFVTMGLVAIAQILTGLGVFDSIAKFAGAGVIVPITGFANSMVAPAIEYKKEGPVLGVGAKLFSVAGPVLVLGIYSAVLVGIVYWILNMFRG